MADENRPSADLIKLCRVLILRRCLLKIKNRGNVLSTLRIAYMGRGTKKKGPMARAENLFNQTQKHKQNLSENEKAKQAEREKVARLKALRLTKEATSK